MNINTVSAECLHNLHSACDYEDCVCQCHIYDHDEDDPDTDNMDTAGK